MYRVARINVRLLAGLFILFSCFGVQAGWQTVTTLPTPRVQLGVAAIGNMLYAAGGSSSGTYLSTLEAWNATTGSWATLTPMPTARAYVELVPVGTTLYAIGGKDSSSTFAINEAYDTVAGSWQPKTSMREPRVAPAVAALNGLIYAFGGSANGAYLATAERYDAATNQWTQIASMPTARELARAAVIDGKIYVTGGRKGFGSADGVSVTEIYDPATNSWQSGPALPAPRFGHASVVIDSAHYIAGGTDGSSNSKNAYTVLDDAVSLAAGGSAWVALSDRLPEARWGVGGVVIGGDFYVVGGFDTDTQAYVASIVKLTPATATANTGERLSISASDLAAMIAMPVIYGTPPAAFRDTDPLGVTGVSLLDAQASLVGDTLRVDNIVIDNVSYWIDFRYDSATGRFQPGTLTAGTAPALSRSDLPGIGTTSPPAKATLGGPPLAADIWPIMVQGTPLGVGLLFSTSNLSFSIRDARPLDSGFVAALSGGSFAGDPIDDYIAAQGQVDTHLKSGADWNAAALSCASKLIGTLNLGSVGTKALQMMASDGPEVFQGMREALLMGNPQDATLVFSQFAWKALAENASSDSELAAVFKAIASKAGYVQSVSQGAGACTVDYKQGLESLLKGAVSTAFPITSCAAELAYEGIKEARTKLNDNILQRLYQQWKALGDDGDMVFDYPMVRGDTGLFGTLVRQKYGSEYDTYLQNPERYFDLIATELKARFRQWKAAEAAGNTTRTRLQELKSRFDTLGGYKSDISALLPEGADDTQVFKRYVELMQRFRTRLAPFMPSTLNAATLDSYAESALYAYLDPPAGKSRQAAWQDAVASQIRSWQPDLFADEPEVCLLKEGGDVELASMTLAYNYMRESRQLTATSYCTGSSSATKGSYYFTNNTSQSGSNLGYITSSGSSFSASCTNANCPTQITCQGTVSGTTSSASLSMTCTQGSTTLNITGTTSSGLTLVSGTGSGQTYDQAQGKYVTCDGLNVNGTVSGSFGIGVTGQ